MDRLTPSGSWWKTHKPDIVWLLMELMSDHKIASNDRIMPTPRGAREGISSIAPFTPTAHAQEMLLNKLFGPCRPQESYERHGQYEWCRLNTLSETDWR
jgi:hypothetical protein